MKIKTRKIFLNHDRKEKGYLTFQEISDEDKGEDHFCYFTLDTIYSCFYLKPETVELIIKFLKKYVLKGTTTNSRWVVGSSFVSSPHYVRSVYRIVLNEVWLLLVDPYNYELIPGEKKYGE